MSGNCWFSKLAAKFAQHGAHVELIYFLDRTAKLSAAIGGRSIAVLFKDTGDLTQRSCAAVLAELCDKLLEGQCSTAS